MRRITREGGAWNTAEVHPAHADRMVRAAERLAAGLPGDRHLVYAEHPTGRTAYLIDTAEHLRAEDDAGRAASVRYHGQIPRPTEDEVAHALHVLHFSGLNLLRPREVQAAWGHHVADAHIPHDDKDPEFYGRVLSSGARLPAALEAVYKKRAAT